VKVKELIAALQGCDPELPVYFWDEWLWEVGGVKATRLWGRPGGRPDDLSEEKVVDHGRNQIYTEPVPCVMIEQAESKPA
jgi:hypothetical protein